MWKLLLLCTIVSSLVSAAPKNEEQEPAKKNKAHFVGVRRSAQKERSKKPASSRTKNPWIKTTTYPKKKEKQPLSATPEEETPSAEIPYFIPL